MDTAKWRQCAGNAPKRSPETALNGANGPALVIFVPAPLLQSGRSSTLNPRKRSVTLADLTTNEAEEAKQHLESA